MAIVPIELMSRAGIVDPALRWVARKIRRLPARVSAESDERLPPRTGSSWEHDVAQRHHGELLQASA
jgi:hypothetical protein